ncbi:hypothetical protein HPB48_012802 [Haemaphysalis longicornis]|uniref:Uncharacterized protein n=1 Tax=Haemaphysalis longicornis TaxID=44386 RepID=A0A9J6FN79_HAELO|nr:hypothetical protein HPB48_012802 [Haemaphysalis longicornis]
MNNNLGQEQSFASAEDDADEEAVLRKYVKDLAVAGEFWVGKIDDEAALESLERELMTLGVSFKTQASYRNATDNSGKYDFFLKRGDRLTNATGRWFFSMDQGVVPIHLDMPFRVVSKIIKGCLFGRDRHKTVARRAEALAVSIALHSALPRRSCEENETATNPTAAVFHNKKVAGPSSSERLPVKLNEPPNENDIGIYVGCPTLPEDTKECVYTSMWTPRSRHDFEVSVSKDGKRLKFQLNWLQRFQWLAYSCVQKGAFCKVCVLFSIKTGTGKGSHETAQSLIISPFLKWKNALEVFENHMKTEYHNDAMIAARSFLEVAHGKMYDIYLQLHKQAKIK